MVMHVCSAVWEHFVDGTDPQKLRLLRLPDWDDVPFGRRPDLPVFDISLPLPYQIGVDEGD
jgi:hypothetical protein